jgi:putative membrane protein
MVGMGMGIGWGFGLLGWLAMVIFPLLVVAVVGWLVLGVQRSAREGDRAAAILAERYARGEIDADEFQSRKLALGRATR